MRKHQLNRFSSLSLNITSHDFKLSKNDAIGIDIINQFAAYLLSDRRLFLFVLALLPRMDYMDTRKRLLKVVKVFDHGHVFQFQPAKSKLQPQNTKTLRLRETQTLDAALIQVIRILYNQRRFRLLLERLGRDALEQAIINVINAIHYLDNTYENELKAITRHERELFFNLESALRSV